jgi:hypothetical protein
MHWTEFDADNQATLMLSLITEHGRATPLLWLTVDKKTLKDRRNLYEVTAERYEVDTVVCVRETDMKQSWCLAASSTDETARDLI